MNEQLLLYTPDQVLWRGLSLAGMSRQRQRRQKKHVNINDFKAYYGAHPMVLAQIWEDLQTTTIPEARIHPLGRYKKRSVNLKNFLRTHNFLKCYQTEDVRKITSGKSKKTLRKWCWYFLKRMHALKGVKVSLDRQDFSAFLIMLTLCFLDCLARGQRVADQLHHIC